MKRDKRLLFGLTAALFFIAFAASGCGEKAVPLEEIGAGEEASGWRDMETAADGLDGGGERAAETADGPETQDGPSMRSGDHRTGSAVSGAIGAGDAAADSGNGASQAGKKQGAGESSIYVYVCGEVATPGVYEAAEGDRLYELIETAGGFTEDAQESALNLAMQAEDGQKIYVPSKEEARLAGGNDWSGQNEAPGEKTGGKININRAAAEELDSLPGIGSAKARSIVAYRKEKGGFGAIEDIKNVSGIGDALFERIRDSITTD